MLQFYQQSLIRSPKLTNSIATGTLFGTGDIIAQLLFPDVNADSKKNQFQINRTLRSVFYGSCVFAFIGDRWYKVLSTIKVPGGDKNPFLNTLAKTTIDQLFFAPIGIPLYYSVMSLLEMKTPAETWVKLKENWLPTLKVNWAVWPAFQLVNFSFVPVNHQLLTVNLFSIAWNTYLSMRNAKKSEHHIVHYPPVPE